MKPRPPTLRTKRRYLLVRVLPPWQEAGEKALYLAVADAVTSLFGDARAAAIQPAVLSCEDGYAILRCQRGMEDDLAIACSTVTAVGEIRIALRTVAVSGTIAALKRRLAEGGPAKVPETVTYGEKASPAFRYGRHKVDVLQEGIKKQSRVFLTDHDREEI
ncbi:Rpp14/Pop5 family protein [uncultured Methanofollis sp.]|uniref:Rpp14/Pop5 family protein n=1 Tax=uncultured Methanofollis sp. TaxID=262500 RepID=UPI00262EF18D|nr:Rpp14/Pop5 family protein [uncultured Methanofollis sp.]